MCTDELGTRVFRAGLFERRAGKMQRIQVREHAASQRSTTHNAGCGKQRCRQIEGISLPRNLNRLAHSASDHNERHGRRTFLRSSSLHRQDVPNAGPQAAHGVTFERVCNLRARLAACAKKGPRAVETVRHRVFSVEWLIANAAVDALADVSGVCHGWKEIEFHGHPQLNVSRTAAP